MAETDVEATQFRWSRTLPLFCAVMAACSLAFFNYQKMASPVMASTMYALRTSPRARAYLGDEIRFRRAVPWIAGPLNLVRGHIDVRVSVCGTRGAAVMRFTSIRPSPHALFETTEWSLQTEDGRTIDLRDATDPLAGGSIAGSPQPQQLS